MRRFKWIERNIQKIDVHALSVQDVEGAFDRIYELQRRDDGSYQMYAETPSGRRIWVIWRYDEEGDEIPDVFGNSVIGRFLYHCLLEDATDALTRSRFPQCSQACSRRANCRRGAFSSDRTLARGRSSAIRVASRPSPPSSCGSWHRAKWGRSPARSCRKTPRARTSDHCGIRSSILSEPDIGTSSCAVILI